MPRDVAVVVPWRGGCAHRDAAWEYVQSRYHGAELIVAECPPGPWIKAKAVMPVIAMTGMPLVVVADADVWCDDLDTAIQAVRDGAPWAIPHRRVKRLNERSTARVLAGEQPTGLQLVEPSYVGAPGGGLVVLPTKTALDVPLDPRFEGWGGEDRAWGDALRVLAGEPWRGTAPLWHLWHPPQDRPSRNQGSATTQALRRRYDAARFRAEPMRALLDEIVWED